MPITPPQLAAIDSFADLARLFYQELNWPKEEWSTFAGVTDLYGIDRSTGVQSILAVQQLSYDQNWGIFLVDFGENKLSRSQLRAILNKVAERERQSHAERTWAHENILFICRSQRTTWTLGHYAGDKPATAKLKTFGWSDPLSARTFLTRNLPYLQWQDQSHWEKAWDAEALTADFYKEYKRVFDLVEQQTKHPKDADTKKLFVQSLFNRLMFLAFIERMGWVSIDGNKDYLYTLYQRHKAKPAKDAPTFYDVLELLFFSGLNSVNGIGGGHHLAPILGEVPYLNGGLFQRDTASEPLGISIPDVVFSGIFSDPDGLFRRYTFTVTESTPFDIDVAVDPEMLGKIFEELVTGRHETGSYYTPRPVVSFMCREALKGFLAENGIEPTKATQLVDEHDPKPLGHEEIGRTLDLLGSIKIVDPACGSGAYLLGMMRELFDLVQIVERRRTEASPRELYKVKLDIIQNNLYGVDIDPFAVNIARLRMWLSLAVDHKGTHPEPLPNLDYKIETGDSLLAPNPTASIGQMDIFREKAIADFDRLKREFGKPATTIEEANGKEEIKKQIDALRSEMRDWYGSKTKAKTGVFDWRIEFAEVFQDRHDQATLGGNLNLGLEAGSNGQGELANASRPGGFDVVLANPPYVRADAQFKHLLPNERAQERAIQDWKAFRENLKASKIYETLHEKWDLYIPFLERAHQILSVKGQMVFIIPDAYNGNKYAIKSHSFFLERSQIERIDFCSQIPLFKAGVSNTILHFSKQIPSASHTPTRARRWGDSPSDFELNCELYGGITQADGKELIFRPLAERNATIGDDEVPLSHLCYISVGAVLHADEKDAHKAFKLDDLISDHQDTTHPKKLFMGKNMGSWTVVGNSWLEYGTARAPALFRRKTFPELYEVPEKLVTMDLSGSSLRIIYDDNQCWHNHSAWSLVPWHYLAGVQNKSLIKSARYKREGSGKVAISKPREELEILSKKFDLFYLLGLMNSEFARHWMARQRRNKMHIYPDDWKPFPVKVLRPEEQKPVVDIVRQIVEIKKSDPTANVEALEEQLDQYVDFIYNHKLGDETFEEWNARLEAEAATEVGALRALVRGHEGPTVEFKESLEEPDPLHKKLLGVPEQYLEQKKAEIRKEVFHSALKSICALRNSPKCGTLLIGVKDDRTIIGLARDYNAWNATNPRDAFLQKLAPALKIRFRPPLTGLLHPEFIVVDGMDVCRIDVPHGPTCYLDDTLYIRNLSTTEALAGPELEAWLKGREEPRS